jgi:hypothetical protein
VLFDARVLQALVETTMRIHQKDCRWCILGTVPSAYRLRDRGQPACKPGFVGPERRYLGRGDHSSGTAVAGRLKQPTRTTSLETSLRRSGERPCRPYSVLLPVGFAVPSALPRPRCALTAPFHPDRQDTPDQVRGRRPAAVCFLWHCPWSFPRRRLSGTALPWSPDFPPQAQGARSGRPAG